MIALGRDFVDGLAPVDFAHWGLLIGAVLMIPFTVNLNRTLLERTTSYILLMGIIGIVGMCVIDFIIWSYPPGADRNAFIEHISAEPAVWMPFIQVGPWLFGIGLAMASFSYLAVSKSGVSLVILGSLVSATTTSWFTVGAYVIITIGYVLCFRGQDKVAVSDT